MKTKLITLFFILMSFFLNAQDEDIVVIPGGLENAGKLEAIINSDTTATGERENPNRIYELEAGTFYIQHAPIRIHNPNGTLTIRGQQGGTKPIIVKQAINEVDIAKNQINGSLTLQNLQYHGMQPNGHINYRFWELEGPDRTLIVENCLMENAFGMYFNLNPCLSGLKIVLKNNYWRDLFNHKERWEHRILTAKVPVDSFIFENNTITGGGLSLLIQGSLVKYAVINHNTIINNHNYPFLNVYYKELYFTNNLLVNGFMLGEDKVNIADGGQDPDKLLMGIINIDTISTSIRIQDEFIDENDQLTEEVDGLDDIIYYAADNILTYSTEFDEYYSGAMNSHFDDAPASYLSGPNNPLKIYNVPAIWNNERTEALIADWDNIQDKNNHIYTISLDELGLGTTPLTQEAADVFTQWMRFMYGDRDVLPPTSEEWISSGYHFGDYDPTTIPGIETEDGSGISRISDLVEDFSYTHSVRSKSDGYPIGALHWTTDIDDFDSKSSLEKIKKAYENAVNGITSSGDNYPAANLDQNYPNPFSDFTTITYAVNSKGKVSLKIFDIQGRLIETMVDVNQNAGIYQVTWNPDDQDVSNGVYFYKLETPGASVAKKMIYKK